MALTMHRGRDNVRFEWTDGVVESTVTLLPEDEQAVLISKLKRVIALVEGEQALEPLDRLRRLTQQEALAGVRKGFPKPPRAAEPPSLGEAQKANGWELYTPEELEDAPGEAG